jgi:hypothetical protein
LAACRTRYDELLLPLHSKLGLKGLILSRTTYASPNFEHHLLLCELLLLGKYSLLLFLLLELLHEHGLLIWGELVLELLLGLTATILERPPHLAATHHMALHSV